MRSSADARVSCKFSSTSCVRQRSLYPEWPKSITSGQYLHGARLKGLEEQLAHLTEVECAARPAAPKELSPIPSLIILPANLCSLVP